MNAQQYMQASLSGWRAIPRVVWLGLGAVLVGALVIVYAVGIGAPATAGTAASVQTLPDAATQSVADYLRAHASVSDRAGAPDAATQGVAGYLRAHGADISARAQTVPDAATQSVMDYIHAHSADAGVRPQIVPDAATRAVIDYIHAHGQQ